MSDTIRKPRRVYPLPEDLKELDEPHCECNRRRYSRCVLFKEGYDVSKGRDPALDTIPRSPSNILSEL